MCAYCTPNTTFLPWTGKSCISLGFSALWYWLFWEFTSPRKENQALSEKSASCRSTSPSYTDQRNQLQKLFLITKSYSYKAWTVIISYVIVALNGWLRNALTEQLNMMIHGRIVLWATAVTACGQHVKVSIAMYIATVCWTNSKWPFPV
jgi:hypothetical protein